MISKGNFLADRVFFIVFFARKNYQYGKFYKSLIWVNYARQKDIKLH